VVNSGPTTNTVTDTATTSAGSRRSARLTANGTSCGWSLQLLAMRKPLIAKNITTPISPNVQPLTPAKGSALFVSA